MMIPCIKSNNDQLLWSMKLLTEQIVNNLSTHVIGHFNRLLKRGYRVVKIGFFRL